MGLITLINFCESLGSWEDVSIPNTKGTPRRIPTEKKISYGSRRISFRSIEVGAYVLAQKVKLNGVRITAATLEKAVKLIDKAVLPFAK